MEKKKKNSKSKLPKGKGRCFENAVKFMLTTEGNPNYKLVHGYPTGTGGNAKGIKYGHAWVELSDEVVIDPSISGKPPKFCLKNVYYEVGSIKEKEVRKYTYDEMREQMLLTNHYGIWHKVEGGYCGG